MKLNQLPWFAVLGLAFSLLCIYKTMEVRRELSITPSSDFCDTWTIAIEMHNRKVRCEQHCNQWFAEDGSVESVSADGNWLVASNQDGSTTYTAIHTTLLDYRGGLVFITAGKSVLRVPEGTVVVLCGMNIKTGIEGEYLAAIYVDGPVFPNGSNVISNFGFSL